MFRRTVVACGVFLALLSAGQASAQSCSNFVVSYADGRVIGPLTNSGGALTVPYFQPNAGHSYSIEVRSADPGTVSAIFGGPTQTCPTANDPAMVNNNNVEPRGDLRSARVSYTATGNGFVVVRVDNGSFYYSVTDTTLYNSSWSTAGTFATQWGLQNTTGSTITGTLTVKESFGGSANYTKAVTLPPNVTTFITTFDTFVGGPIPAGRGGSATFTHSGPANSVLGDGYLVNAAGTVFVPTVFRAMRDIAR